MNAQEVSRTVVTVVPHDYLHFVIKEDDNEVMVKRIARQEVKNAEIICRVTRYVWNKFQEAPFDTITYAAVRQEMRSEYSSEYSRDNHPSLETLKSHVLDRLGDSLWEAKEEVKAHEALMLQVETTHNLSKLIPHIVREFGLDHGRPINEIVTQLLCLLHPELFEGETAGES